MEGICLWVYMYIGIHVYRPGVCCCTAAGQVRYSLSTNYRVTQTKIPHSELVEPFYHEHLHSISKWMLYPFDLVILVIIVTIVTIITKVTTVTITSAAKTYSKIIMHTNASAYDPGRGGIINLHIIAKQSVI